MVVASGLGGGLINTIGDLTDDAADRKPGVAIVRMRREHIGAIETQGVAIGRARGRTGPQAAIGTCIVQ